AIHVAVRARPTSTPRVEEERDVGGGTPAADVTFMLRGALLVFALGATALASAAIACSGASDKDNAVSSADLAVPVEADSGAGSALEIDTWKTLGGSGAWAHVKIEYPHFVAPTPSSAGGVINAKLETALQKLAEDQKDAASATVTCSAPGDAGAK